MKPSLQRFAPLGLYLSLAALLAAAGLYIVQKEFSLYVQIALGLVVIGLAAFAILNPQGVRKAFTGRQAKYGSNALVLLVAFIGIVAVINYIVNQNNKRWDLTDDQEHTLAGETIQTLTSIKEPVSAVAYYTSRMSKTTAENLLKEFKLNSDGIFDYKFVDPEVDPVSANNDQITRDGTIVFKIGDRSEQVTTITETEMVSAIIRLSSPGERTVYFLAGHGEYDPDGSGEESYSQAKQLLTGKNYTVKVLSLLVDRQIPEDALALVAAGHRKPYSEEEVSLIKAYLEKGGSLVVFLEPDILTDFGGESDPLTQMLVQDYGFQFANDLVIDTNSNVATFAIAGAYGSSPIVNEINANQLYTVFPTARSLRYTDPGSLNPIDLVSTSAQTWSETDLEALQNNEAAYDEGADLLGPITLGVSMENNETGSRLVVFGDADFAVDAYITAYGNTDLFVNVVDWAAQQDNLINLTAKETTSRFIVAPEGNITGLILLASIVLLPGGVAVAGIVTWIQRRRRG